MAEKSILELLDEKENKPSILDLTKEEVQDEIDNQLMSDF